MAIRFFVFGFFFGSLSTLSNPPPHSPLPKNNTYAHSRVSRNPFVLSHSIPPPPSTHNPTVSRRFFSLARPPRLPPPDTRSTVLIFHRRGNRWPDKKQAVLRRFFLSCFYHYYYYFFNYTIYTYLPSNRFRLKLYDFCFTRLCIIILYTNT
ncbi:unnamed protein product [Aphis gossypii]|uniref:Uncharacterized protein n=1 Tax=Aphis gossypii TaxID=80765 RepID=A0A9P0ITM5_APHGO|nr:unnamed protein product [Aphis gossypii]